MEFFSSVATLRPRKRRNREHESKETKDDETRSSLDGENDEEEGDSVPVTVLDPEEERRRERKRRMEAPPADDICPICFGSFVFPCRGPCGHWYCGGCILLYWNYGAGLQPCKCPMCSQKIIMLTPEASLNSHQGGEIIEKIGKYNLLFVGGIYGFSMKLMQLPLLIKRVFVQMMDPDVDLRYYHRVRYFVILLGIIYCSSPFDFLPKAMDSVNMFDAVALFLFLLLQTIGLCLRWFRQQRARRQLVIR